MLILNISEVFSDQFFCNIKTRLFNFWVGNTGSDRCCARIKFQSAVITRAEVRISGSWTCVRSRDWSVSHSDQQQKQFVSEKQIFLEKYFCSSRLKHPHLLVFSTQQRLGLGSWYCRDMNDCLFLILWVRIKHLQSLSGAWEWDSRCHQSLDADKIRNSSWFASNHHSLICCSRI